MSQQTRAMCRRHALVSHWHCLMMVISCYFIFAIVEKHSVCHNFHWPILGQWFQKRRVPSFNKFPLVGLLAYATGWKTKKNKGDPTFHADTFCPILGPYVILLRCDV